MKMDGKNREEQENGAKVDVYKRQELNNAKPGRLMARHLLELGHRHVAFVSPPLTSKQGQRLKRVEGFVLSLIHI